MVGSAVHVCSAKVNEEAIVPHDRCIPEETAVALVYDGSTYAVMMASPSDLEDFAVGFSLTERIVAAPNEIESLDIVEQTNGIELRMWLAPERRRALAERRRRLAGPTGCGLCGVESLDAVVPSCPRVPSGFIVSPRDVQEALRTLILAQVLNRQTRAVHGAALWTRPKGVVAIAEDVGRHNALDKLVGQLRRAGAPIGEGIVLLTSRVSVEMVQKAAVSGAQIMVAVSAPTALALKTAEETGITLIAVAREDGFEIFTHDHRVEGLRSRCDAFEGSVEHAA